MYWSFLKLGVKFVYLIQNITVAILLQITELLMEPVFICECTHFRLPFVIMYFTIPATAFSALALSLRQGNIFMEICKRRGGNSGDNNATGCCKKCINSPCCQLFFSFCKTLYPAFCWGVILLIDGKYLACGLYSKCNSTMTTVDMKDPEMVHGMMLSKVWGLTAVGVFVLLYFISLCLVCCCRNNADRYVEMYMSQLEEDREKFTRTYAKTCSERRRAWCEEELRKAESEELRKAQSEAGNPTSGAENPTPSGAGNPTSSGAENPKASGAGNPTSSGAENPTASGAGNPTSSGAENPTPSGTGNPTSSGAENPTASGAGNPTSSGAGNPTPSGAENPTSSGAENPTASGAGNPTSSGAENPTPSGAGNTTASGAGNPTASGAGNPTHSKAKRKTEPGAGREEDPGHFELRAITRRDEPQLGAAGGADLDAKIIVDTIEECFSIKYKPGLRNTIMGPSQRASEAGVQSRQDQVSSRPTSEPHQYLERESLLSCENQPSN